MRPEEREFILDGEVEKLVQQLRAQGHSDLEISEQLIVIGKDFAKRHGMSEADLAKIEKEATASAVQKYFSKKQKPN